MHNNSYASNLNLDNKNKTRPYSTLNGDSNLSVSERNVKQKTSSGNFEIVVDEVTVNNMQVAADETYSTPDLISIDEDVDDTGIDQDEEKISDNETNNNNDQINSDINPVLFKNYNVEYFKHQNNLYSEIFGIEALHSENIQEFKDRLADFEIKRLAISKLFSFAKSCNISRNHGDDLLQLFKDILKSSFPNADIPKYIPDSWKTVTRDINKQISFYTCDEIKIPFPEHWEMHKWKCNNSLPPEEVIIRIRDPMELIADQCVNPIIHFLWKDHVHISCYRKTNSKNEDVFCDIMSSEWARKTSDDIKKSDPKGLLVPISLYADGVSVGMNGQANLIPVMMTLGWYSKELFKQDYGKMVIGYIDKLTDISEEVLIKHLEDLKKGTQKFSRSKCEANIKWFKKKIFYTFWKNVLDKINSASITGIFSVLFM